MGCHQTEAAEQAARHTTSEQPPCPKRHLLGAAVRGVGRQAPELFFASSSPRFEKWYVARDHSSGLAIVEASKLVQPVVVWFRLTESMGAPDIAETRAVLSLDERARCDRFFLERDQRDFAAAHTLLRRALSLDGGLPPISWQFRSDAAGKPFLVGRSELEFNIAHTPGLVACALSLEGPIGVDVELVDHARDTEEIAERYFAEPEIVALKACAPGLERQTRFTELWTLKEAYLKALGVGLRKPLNEFGFQLISGSIQHLNVSTERGNWRFGLFAPLPNYRLAVAVRANPSLKFCVRMWPPEKNIILSPLYISQ